MLLSSVEFCLKVFLSSMSFFVILAFSISILTCCIYGVVVFVASVRMSGFSWLVLCLAYWLCVYNFRCIFWCLLCLRVSPWLCVFWVCIACQWVLSQYFADQFFFSYLMFSLLRFPLNRHMYVTGKQWKGHKRLPVLRHVRQMQLPGRQTCGVWSSSGRTFSYEENWKCSYGTQ